MDYREAREYLEYVKKYGSVLGLDSIKKLLSMLGNPQNALRAVHVAGTNGKGSTITFLQSILMEAGYRVGRYSSPAVFSYREIIRINDDYIERDSLAELTYLISKKCNEMVKEGLPHPTSFEIETALAFMYFKQKGCDIVLVECGMGGESDATNVFEQVLCSIITTISLDHMKFLGNTIEKITEVKAGIIKKHCPVVISNQSNEALNTTQKTAQRQCSELIATSFPRNIRTKDFRTYFSYKALNGKEYMLEIKALGTYQIVNAATALEAALILEKQGFELEGFIETGIKKAVWNGRMEIVNDNPLTVIDGAHNPGAVMELKKSIDFYFTNKRITFIMGVLADKDFKCEAEMIAECAVNIITVTPDNPRALDGRKLAQVLQGYSENVQYAESVEKAYDIAVKTVSENESDMILAFGSLSYLGNLKSIIKTNETNS